MTTDAAAQLAILADALTEIVDLATADPKALAPPAQVLARAGDIAAEALAVAATYGRLKSMSDNSGYRAWKGTLTESGKIGQTTRFQVSDERRRAVEDGETGRISGLRGRSGASSNLWLFRQPPPCLVDTSRASVNRRPLRNLTACWSH